MVPSSLVTEVKDMAIKLKPLILERNLQLLKSITVTDQQLNLNKMALKVKVLFLIHFKKIQLKREAVRPTHIHIYIIGVTIILSDHS